LWFKVISTDFGEISDFDNTSGVAQSGHCGSKRLALISEKSATLKTHWAGLNLVIVAEGVRH